jgi:hypothetical protein
VCLCLSLSSLSVILITSVPQQVVSTGIILDYRFCGRVWRISGSVFGWMETPLETQRLTF